MFKATLEFYGFMVHTASSPKEAITACRDNQRDIGLVLLDYLLPEMSGKMVFENLQCLNPGVRVVLSSGYEESVADKMLKRGLWGYPQKWFSLTDLVKRVRDPIDAPVLARSAPQSAD